MTTNTTPNAKGAKAPKLSPEERDRKRKADFVRLAQPRMTKALKALRNVEKLANSRSYDWSEAQAEGILRALSARFTAIRDGLQRRSADAGAEEFRFDGGE